jgi:hypothetical protein
MKRSKEQAEPIQQQFEEAARRHRRDPNKMLAKFMRECLEIWEDQQLDKEIQRQARRSGYKEADAVKLVREVRQAKRQNRGKP